MNTDDLVKILLAVSLSFAIVGLAFVIMRFINKLTSILEDVRKPVKNVGELSDLALSDYKGIRGVVTSLFGLSGILKTIMPFLSKLGAKESDNNKDKEDY